MTSLPEDGGVLDFDFFSYIDNKPLAPAIPGASWDAASAQTGPWSSAPSAQQQPHQAPRRKNSSNTIGTNDGSQRYKRVRDVDKVRELEALAAEKAMQLEALVAHNTQLKYRHGVLTRALELRDYTLRVMSSKSGTCPAPPSWAMALPRSATGIAPAAGCTGPGQGQEQQGSCISAGVCPVVAPAPAPADTLAEAVWVPGSVALLLGVQPPVNHERLARIGRSELVCAWQRFLSSASTHLLALEERHGDEGAAEGLLAATSEMTCLFKHVALLAPDTFLLVQQTHLQTGELSAPDPQHWEAVVHAMELTEEQCRELRVVYELFTKILAGIHAERQAIKRRLAEGLALNPTAACPPCGPGPGQGQGPACSLGGGCAAGAPSAAPATAHANPMHGLAPQEVARASSDGVAGAAALSPAGSFLSPASSGEAAGAGGGVAGGSCGEACMTRLLLMSGCTPSPEQEVLPALQRSMRQEKTAHLLLRGFLMGRVLSIVQVARMAVKSYPWFPNFSAVVATVGEMAPGDLAQMTAAAAAAAAARGTGVFA